MNAMGLPCVASVPSDSESVDGGTQNARLSYLCFEKYVLGRVICGVFKTDIVPC